MARKPPLDAEVGNASDIIFIYKSKVESGNASKEEKDVYYEACATFAGAQTLRGDALNVARGTRYIALGLMACALFWWGLYLGAKLIFSSFVQAYLTLAHP